MCKKDLDLKVRECGAAYGMDIYSDHELLSLVLGISPERLTGGIQDILDFPAKIQGIGKRKELAVFAVKELARRLMRRESSMGYDANGKQIRKTKRVTATSVRAAVTRFG